MKASIRQPHIGSLSSIRCLPLKISVPTSVTNRAVSVVQENQILARTEYLPNAACALKGRSTLDAQLTAEL